jgi:hypothetical protein
VNKENLTLISVIPIQRVQADNRQLIGYHINREVRASLEDVIILCRNKVAPDTVLADEYDVTAICDPKGTHSVKLLVTAFGPATRML